MEIWKQSDHCNALQNSFHMELSSSKLQRLVKCKAKKSLDSRCKRCNSEFSVVPVLWGVKFTVAVQHAVQCTVCSVLFSMHCFQFSIQCTVFSIQYLVHFTAPGALCVAG